VRPTFRRPDFSFLATFADKNWRLGRKSDLCIGSGDFQAAFTVFAYGQTRETRGDAAENARRRLLDITVESRQLSHATRGMPLKFILFIGRIARRTLGSPSRHRDARSGWIRPRKYLAKRHSRFADGSALCENRHRQSG